ncbi:Porphobilinogen deaminase [Chryseobacterium taklimakanense]|uniref:Hydroxymethylbilane synthase n=1 Tax=Chryseobacterium taklimakanense TaxID=536441 RepID=A0A239XF55_9FLAO|nr:hydroxymethylbilane synthase [Chryseobacterium taklimakanense]SNV45072.1 Porphobilinogen deaminase [Chryseobacterium taklimakanense]
MKNIRIGTRNSPLAMWQAETVAAKLQQLGCETEIVPIISSGDKHLDLPLYAMGITGVFTRDLDIALLQKEIDIAVHSLKDVPTQLPENVELIAYLERDFPQDILVRSSAAKNKDLKDLKIATSSLRRRAFWAKEFPHTEFTDIRGNVQTRLRKLDEGVADATMFSRAGIERLGLPVVYEELPMMISAPSQGVVAVAGLSENVEINEIVRKISDIKTQICVEIERDFLAVLEGGCTAPIGAFAEFNENQIRFVGRLCSLDGKNCIETDEIFDYDENKNFGEEMANKILDNGGRELMDEIKKSL